MARCGNITIEDQRVRSSSGVAGGWRSAVNAEHWLPVLRDEKQWWCNLRRTQEYPARHCRFCTAPVCAHTSETPRRVKGSVLGGYVSTVGVSSCATRLARTARREVLCLHDVPTMYYGNGLRGLPTSPTSSPNPTPHPTLAVGLGASHRLSPTSFVGPPHALPPPSPRVS